MSMERRRSCFDGRGYEGYEVRLRLERNEGYEPCRIRGPGDVYLLMRHLADEPVENMYELLMNTRQSIVGIYHISKGTLDASLLDPKEVFRPALMTNATGFILVHNHPSGDPSPSREDKAVTSQLEQGAKILGISFLDHVIIGAAGSYVSMSEGGLL